MLRDLPAADWPTALWMLEWAGGPEAAAIDLDLALRVRRLLRPGASPDAVWEGAWRAACELVLRAHERSTALNVRAGPPRPVIADEPLVRLAAQLLQAHQVAHGAARSGTDPHGVAGSHSPRRAPSKPQHIY